MRTYSSGIRRLSEYYYGKIDLLNCDAISLYEFVLVLRERAIIFSRTADKSCVKFSYCNHDLVCDQNEFWRVT